MNIFKKLQRFLIVAVLAGAGSVFAGQKDVENVTGWFEREMSAELTPVFSKYGYPITKHADIECYVSNLSASYPAVKGIYDEIMNAKASMLYIAKESGMSSTQYAQTKPHELWGQLKVLLESALKDIADKQNRHKSFCNKVGNKGQRRQVTNEFLKQLHQENRARKNNTKNDDAFAIELFKQLNPGQKLPAKKKEREEERIANHFQCKKNDQTGLQCGRNSTETARWIAQYGDKTYETCMKNLNAKDFAKQIEEMRTEVNNIAVAFDNLGSFENLSLAQMYGLNNDSPIQKVGDTFITVIAACSDSGVPYEQERIEKSKLVQKLAKRFKKTGKEVVIFNTGGHWSTMVFIRKNDKSIASIGIDSSSPGFHANRQRIRSAVMAAILSV